MRNTKVQMDGSEKKSGQEHIQHFPIKRVIRKFLEISRYSRAKQWQRNVHKKCDAGANLFLC